MKGLKVAPPAREECLAMNALCLSASLRKTERVVTRHYDAWLAPAGVTAVQLPILAKIEAEEDMSLRQLSEELDLDRSTLSRNLGYLRERGWVKLGPSSGPKPGRISLTAKGRDALARAHQLWREAHHDLESTLSEKVMSESLALLKRVRRKTREAKAA